jgi:signal peptidase I
MTFDDRPMQSHTDTDRPPPPSGAYDTPQSPDGPATTQPEPGAQKKQASLAREIVETLLLAIIIFVAVRAVVLNFRVDGLSMTPSLNNNEMLLVNRNAYLSFDTWSFVDWVPGIEHDEPNTVFPFSPPERGDIVVFNAPVSSADKPYIKRVIGLEGETVEIRDNAVYIDGQLIDEPYLEGAATFCSGGRDCGEVEVPPGSVFVLGDNRDNSQDSRVFGPVSVDSIIGKAWMTYWPISEMGVVPHFDYPEISNQP